MTVQQPAVAITAFRVDHAGDGMVALADGCAGVEKRIKKTNFSIRKAIMLQLNPPIPVYLVDQKKCALAHGWIDYGPEHNLIWICGLDTTGEVWCVVNSKVRLRKNITMGRAGK